MTIKMGVRMVMTIHPPSNTVIIVMVATGNRGDRDSRVGKVGLAGEGQ